LDRTNEGIEDFGFDTRVVQFIGYVNSQSEYARDVVSKRFPVCLTVNLQ